MEERMRAVHVKLLQLAIPYVAGRGSAHVLSAAKTNKKFLASWAP
jgi:hypothetical protein